MLTNTHFHDGQTPCLTEFLLKLRNIFSAECYCLRRIPGVIDRIPRNELWRLLDNHLPVIEARKNRIEKIFFELKVKAGGDGSSTFKKLISKAGTIINHSKNKGRNTTSFELITTLLEISIYRSYIYNHLDQLTGQFDNPVISASLKRSLIEEDHFFHALLGVKKQLSPINSNITVSTHQAIQGIGNADKLNLMSS